MMLDGCFKSLVTPPGDMMQNSSLTLRRFLNGPVLALATAAALSLSGCLASDDDKEETGNGFSFSLEGTVVSHTAPQGGAPGALVIESSEYTCWDDEDEVLPAPVFSTSRDTSQYAIDGGKLYLWSKGECWAQAYTGSSATIQGTWTSTTLNATKIPVAYRSEACVEEYESCTEGGWCEDSYNDDEMVADLKAVTTISAETVRSSVSGQFCMASLFMEGFLGDETPSGLEMVSTGCTSARIRNTTANKVATLTSTSSSTTNTLTFKYNGATCTMNQHFGPINANTQCAEADGDIDTDAFTTCVVGSGFFAGVEFGGDEEFSLGKPSSEKARSTLEILKGGLSPFVR